MILGDSIFYLFQGDDTYIHTYVRTYVRTLLSLLLQLQVWAVAASGVLSKSHVIAQSSGFRVVDQASGLGASGLRV